MAPSLLLIPAELQVMIIGNLDAKSIQRARGVCRETRDVIDAHKATFAKAIQNTEIARLQAFIDHHDYRNLPFLQALRRWIRHRAILANSHSGLHDATIFMVHFMASRAPTQDFALSHPIETMPLASLIMKVHSKQDPPTLPEPREKVEYFKKLVEVPGRFADFCTFSTIDHNLCWEVCKDVAAHPADFTPEDRAEGVEGLGYFKLGRDNLLMPIHCLTKLCVRGPLPHFGRSGAYTEPHKQGEIKLQQILDVPSLFPGDVFAYCARDRWAEQKILQANAATTATTTGPTANTTAVTATAATPTAAPTTAAPTTGALTTAATPIDPLLKAALLERVFIY